MGDFVERGIFMWSDSLSVRFNSFFIFLFFGGEKCKIKLILIKMLVMNGFDENWLVVCSR